HVAPSADHRLDVRIQTGPRPARSRLGPLGSARAARPLRRRGGRMRLTILLNLLHVVTAFVLITGILGRGLTMRDAGPASGGHRVGGALAPRGGIAERGR